MRLVFQILDLVPILAHQYFSERLPVSLHGAQAAVLFCLGLQDKDIGTVKVSSSLIPSKSKVLGILIKISHSCSLIYLITGRARDRKGTGSIELHKDNEEVVWLPS
jgi:hypothetical protein